jgi:hypothetical protein
MFCSQEKNKDRPGAPRPRMALIKPRGIVVANLPHRNYLVDGADRLQIFICKIFTVAIAARPQLRQGLSQNPLLNRNSLVLQGENSC